MIARSAGAFGASALVGVSAFALAAPPAALAVDVLDVLLLLVVVAALSASGVAFLFHQTAESARRSDVDYSFAAPLLSGLFAPVSAGFAPLPAVVRTTPSLANRSRSSDSTAGRRRRRRHQEGLGRVLVPSTAQPELH